MATVGMPTVIDVPVLSDDLSHPQEINATDLQVGQARILEDDLMHFGRQARHRARSRVAKLAAMAVPKGRPYAIPGQRPGMNQQNRNPAPKWDAPNR